MALCKSQKNGKGQEQPRAVRRLTTAKYQVQNGSQSGQQKMRPDFIGLLDYGGHRTQAVLTVHDCLFALSLLLPQWEKPIHFILMVASCFLIIKITKETYIHIQSHQWF